jgi:hypothetical protein
MVSERHPRKHIYPGSLFSPYMPLKTPPIDLPTKVAIHPPYPGIDQHNSSSSGFPQKWALDEHGPMKFLLRSSESISCVISDIILKWQASCPSSVMVGSVGKLNIPVLRQFSPSNDILRIAFAGLRYL